MREAHGGTQAGFALVEVLVSLALAALIAVLLVDTVRVAGRTSTAVAAEEEAEQVQSVRDHLRRTLGSLASRHVDGTLPALRGGPDALSAAIAPDAALERPVEVVARFEGSPRADGGYDLVESRLPLETLEGLSATVRSEVLLERVAGLALRYFGPPAKGAPPVWLPSWVHTDRQPDLIEVRIAFPPGDRRRWPPLVLATGDLP